MMIFKASLKRFFTPKIVFAHCDIPCGIYDPHEAQVAALTVMRMIDLMDESEDMHDITRYILVKEQHAEKCKHEIRVIFGDYFKDEHIEKHPDLYELNHKVMQLASKVRQGKDRGVAKELLEAVNRIAEIFWESKGVKIKKVNAPYSVQDEIVVPEL